MCGLFLYMTENTDESKARKKQKLDDISHKKRKET